MHRTLLTGLALLLLAACHQPQSRAPETLPPPLLLISIDGFRHDYFERTETPALDRLLTEGLKADALVHVFPTKTFSTHYSTVTGLYAENSGVISNSMWDPRRRARFSLGNREAVMDGFWYDGEPIWVTAEKQGLKAATYFWPGSEARIAGVRPTWWMPYRGATSHADRIAQVLEWFDLPSEERPSLVTLYFSRIDSQGHRYGPESVEVEAAIADVDHHLGMLFDQLEARGLFDDMHIIVTSDHGMSEIDRERTIMLDEYLDLDRVRVSDWGPAAMIWEADMDTDAIVEALQHAHPRMRVWRRADIPSRYGFRNHPRIPDVLAEADLGWMISNRPYEAGRDRYPLRGMHGWDPLHQEMGGILIARGPAFRPGSRMGRVQAIHLYELMSALLDLQPAANDGDLRAFAGYAELPALAEQTPLPAPPVLYGDRDRDWPVHSVTQALAEHEALADTPIALEGEITQVCQNRGCWAVLVEGDQTIRIMARDHNFALPANTRGRARAFGVLREVELSDGHARHLVEDDGADPALLDNPAEYRLIADAVWVF